MFEGRDLSDSSDTVRFWFTAGGGVEEGESLTDAAERELAEETGMSGLVLVGPFHVREFDFLNHGEPEHQVEHYFAARTNDVSINLDGWTPLEQAAMTRWRWWSAEELTTGGVNYFPNNLADLVRSAARLV